ncbi:type I DNA topoisomerase [Candidatus Dojkabacteria bacterium]|nr:type I DNA topoisomerase [Candidatus Dojkabacteria bacterium]
MAKKSYKNLVLVESPAKAKTIEKYLGQDYKVKATMGHIIDLPSKGLSVDVENKYEPDFAVIKGKKKIINELQKHLPENGKVYLAMDPDREGEAIAYHAANALKLEDSDYSRITFNEITKTAVNSAIKKPGKIDKDLVEAQFARRVLDRLVGYKVSALLWKKMWYGLSAGRVQSVALRLLVERERLIQKFVPKEYWDILGKFADGKSKLEAELSKINDKKAKVESEKEAKTVEKSVVGKKFKIIDVNKREVSRRTYPPYTTSTLQQAANNLMGFSSKRTMAVAQRLYQAGYITYMRTDSVHLSKGAVDAARQAVKAKFGEKYIPKKPNYFKNKSRLAQEAHEAIRPTDLSTSLDEVKSKIGKDGGKLYDLIKKRTLACQMVPKKIELATVTLQVEGADGRVYEFKLTGQKVLFDGWKRVWGGDDGSSKDTLQEIKDLKEGMEFTCEELVMEQKWTKPKARYTEASLVKALEKYGVGRPSTYSSIISTIISRGYVVKDRRNLIPTDVGMVVVGFLEKNFGKFVDYDYTAKVEEDLDKIAEGKVEYVPFIDGQYKPMMEVIGKVDKSVDKQDVLVLDDSEYKCPKCGAKTIVKLGRYGKFISCSKFPECDGMLDIEGKEVGAGISIDKIDTDKYQVPKKCPKCEKKLILKEGRYGKYWACEDYPKECKGTVPMLLKEECPECGEALVERKGKWGKMFIGCSGYPDCRYIKKSKKSKRSKKSSKKSKSKSKSKSRSKKKSKKSGKKK